VQVHVRQDVDDAPLEVAFASGTDWRWSSRKVSGWQDPLFPDRAWRRAVVTRGAALPPQGYDAHLQSALAMAALHGRTRAALTPANPLTTALGRPTREQVVTVRTDAPTTLQALELTNGEALALRLRKGAQRLAAEEGATTTALVQRVYTRALSRPPTAREAALAAELIGPVPRVEGVEDLLWAVVMLPEFQLIR
jgi:hypothetical protein